MDIIILEKKYFPEEAPTVKQKSRQSIETVKPVLSVSAEKNRQSIENVKPVLSVSAEKTVEVKQRYLPPGNA
jgi:hypothetical protein